MQRFKIRNHAFDRIGSTYGHVIDHDHFLGRSSFDIPRKERFPLVNIREEGELYIMQLLVPGFTKDEVSVTLKDGILIVEGGKIYMDTDESNTFILEEFDINSFKRCFRLAESISQEKISAKLEHGVLTLTFVDVPPEEETHYREITVD